MAAQPSKVSPEYIAWLATTDRAIMGHLYQFTNANGVNDYFTDLDIDVYYNEVIWKSKSLRFEGLQRKIAIGLNVDEQSMKVWAAPTDTVFGEPFLQNVQAGALDGALISRSRIIWKFVTGNAATDIKQPPIAAWVLFTGYTSVVDKGGTSHIELKIKSALNKLDVNMPRNYFQPGCNWTLFSPGCTLIKSAFAVAGTVAAGPNSITIPVAGGIATPTGLDGLPQYQQGRLLFTSGQNKNLQVFIDSNDSSNLYLAYPLSIVPSVGDTFNYFPGCSKLYNTCSVKFSNANNFRGFDKVPPVMVSM